MDRATEEFNKANHVLLHAKIRLNTVITQIFGIEKDLALLNTVEANIQENLGWLRRKRITVSVAEYGKAMVDLNTCRARQAFLRLDRDNCFKIRKNYEIEYEKARLLCENAYRKMHDPTYNVIKVDFGSKNGQK